MPNIFINQPYIMQSTVAQTFMCLQVQYEMNWFSTSGLLVDFIAHTT